MNHTEPLTQPIEHKQRWHSSESYMLPTDDEESARLQLQHDITCELFDNRLVLCPLEIKSGDEVLDVGTGKVAWALDFFSSYPNASESNTKLVCIDITDRLFPKSLVCNQLVHVKLIDFLQFDTPLSIIVVCPRETTKSPPSNISFHVQNVLNLPPDWTGRFAFVLQRLLMAGLKKDEWDRAVKEVHRVTKDGGWVQFCECDAVSHMDGCGPVSARFMELYEKMWEALGLDPACSLNIGPIMERTGFVNDKTENRVVQLGEWNGDVGANHKINLMGVYRGFKTPILKLGGLGIVKDEEEFDKLMDEMEEEWKKPGSAYAFYVTTGQEPKN